MLGKIFEFLKSPTGVLLFLLLAFFCKQVFYIALLPIFDGQDEARHYNTIQYLLQPQEAINENGRIERSARSDSWSKEDLSTYNFSEEIQKTAQASNVDILRSQIYNTVIFSSSYDGPNEESITAHSWRPYNYYFPPDIAGKSSLYHKIAAGIEKIFSGKDILVRFYLIRVFSALLGTLAVFLSYQIARTSGFSGRASLVLAGMIAFQPRFSEYFTNINYDVLLIPMFFLFMLGGVLALRDGLNRKNLAILLGAMAGAILTKATGYILVIVFLPLFFFLLMKKIDTDKKIWRLPFFAVSGLVIASVVVFLYQKFFGHSYLSHDIVPSLQRYLSNTLSWSKLLPSSTYWGGNDWSQNVLFERVPRIIAAVEIAALLGFVHFFIARLFSLPYPKFVPEKKYVFFFTIVWLALEAGVRIADWAAYNHVGSMSEGLGTPGRYFLPALAAHLLLIFAGIGYLLAFLHLGKIFENILIAFLVLMFAFHTYFLFNVIILRFYF